MRNNRPFGKLLAFLHKIAFKNNDVLGERNEMFFLGTDLRVLQNKTPFSAHSSTHLDDAIDLGDLGGVFRSPRLEQFGHTRQTAGDIFRFRHFSRRLGQQCARTNFLIFFDDHMRTGGNGIVRQHFFLVAHDDDLRMQILLVLDNHRAHEAGCFIDITLDRHARDHIAEFNFAALIGQNRHVVRVPLHEGFALFNRRLVLLRNH